MAIPAKDTGYSWTILVAATLLHTLMSSSFSTVGIYYVELLEYFQVDKTELSWIGACQIFTAGISGLFGGPIIKSCGCRTLVILGSVLLIVGYVPGIFTYNYYVLYFTLGLLAGTGFGFYYLAGAVIVQQYFDKRRSTATGITAAGLSVGTFLWPPVVERLIRLYSWRGALLIHGAILMHGLALSGLMRPFPESNQQQSQKNSIIKEQDTNVTELSSHYPQEICSRSNGSQLKATCSRTMHKWSSKLGATLLTDPSFLFLCIAGYFMDFGHVAVLAFLPLRAVELGYSQQRAAMLMSASAACGGVCRLAMGAVGDKFSHHRPIISATALILAGTFALISVFLEQYWMLVCYATLFGVAGATYIALLPSVAVDIVGTEHVAKGLGIFCSFQSLAAFALFPISGALIDATGKAAYSFFVFGATQIVSGVFYCVVQYLKSRKLRQSHLASTQKTVDTAKDWRESEANFGSII